MEDMISSGGLLTVGRESARRDKHAYDKSSGYNPASAATA